MFRLPGYLDTGRLGVEGLDASTGYSIGRFLAVRNRSMSIFSKGLLARRKT